MTILSPVDRIGELLLQSGFKALTVPISVSGIPFPFAAAFVGTTVSSELVVVADTAFEHGGRVLKNVEGLGRALDVSRSKRPLTTILVGPRPADAIVDAMARVCRVLPVGIPEGDEVTSSLYNWLAVLLPLTLPKQTEVLADAFAEIRLLAKNLGLPYESLVEKNSQGADSVQAELHRLIDSKLATANVGDQK